VHREYTSVAQSRLTKTSIARQFACSTLLNVGVINSIMKIIRQTTSVAILALNNQCGHHRGNLTRPTGVGICISFVSSSATSCAVFFPPTNADRIPRAAACALLSIPIMSLHTVFRSQTTCSRRCSFNSFCANPCIKFFNRGDLLVQCFSRLILKGVLLLHSFR